MIDLPSDLKERALRGRTLAWVLLLACVLYAGLALWSELGEIRRAFARFNGEDMLWVMLLVTAGYLLRFLRWRFYLRTLGYSVPWVSDLRIFLASFLMSISPGKVGEAMKSFFLKREFGIPTTPTVAAFFCERFTDVFSIVFLSAAGFLVYPYGGWLMASIFIAQLLFLLVMQKETWIETILFSRMSGIEALETWVERGRRFYETSGDLLSFRNLVVGTVLGGLSWGLEGLCLYLILQGFGVTAVSAPTAIFIFCSAVLLGAASMLPGGIGGSEALMIAMLLFFGTSRSVAVTATLIVRVVTLWYGVGIGAVCWRWSLRRLDAGEATAGPGS